MPKHQIQAILAPFDVTNLLVGAIIGADTYIASSFGAGFLGPLSLLVWIAVVITLCFSHCASLGKSSKTLFTASFLVLA